MRYSYGTNDSFTNGSRTASVKQLASIIKRDVDYGKWNIYEGGETNTRTAKCRYKRNGFIYHEHLLIYGTADEFRRLEGLIKDFITVIPRVIYSENK